MKITLTRSVIGKTGKQKATVVALGLKKTNQTVVKEASPQVMGMINKVKHLIQYEEVK